MDEGMKNINFIIEYHEECKPKNYNNFFHPNVCHVCKKTNEGNLISCNACRMIFYCNNEHRQEHKLQHQEICRFLAQYLEEKGEWDTHRFLISEWAQSRQEFLHIIKSSVPRKLEPYEEQMIIFAKSCVHCHQQIDLITCRICYSDNYCVDHMEEFRSQHQSKCKTLMLCLNQDIRYLNFHPFIEKFITFSWTSPVVDMKSFIQQFVRLPELKSIEQFIRGDYLYSDFVSGPLTFYYSMKNAGLINPLIISRTTYIVHVITENNLDLLYVEAWHLLLHCIRCIKKLIVVVVGSELKDINKDGQFCSKCTHHKQRLCFESYSMLYMEYMGSVSYKGPDVVMGIHANFSNEETWPADLLKSQIRSCPWILTTKSEEKAKENIRFIEKTLGESIKTKYADKNKFRSNRPWRDFETGYVYYRNAYVIIYRDLIGS